MPLLANIGNPGCAIQGPPPAFLLWRCLLPCLDHRGSYQGEGEFLRGGLSLLVLGGSSRCRDPLSHGPSNVCTLPSPKHPHPSDALTAKSGVLELPHDRQPPGRTPPGTQGDSVLPHDPNLHCREVYSPSGGRRGHHTQSKAPLGTPDGPQPHGQRSQETGCPGPGSLLEPRPAQLDLDQVKSSPDARLPGWAWHHLPPDPSTGASHTSAGRGVRSGLFSA